MVWLNLQYIEVIINKLFRCPRCFMPKTQILTYGWGSMHARRKFELDTSGYIPFASYMYQYDRKSIYIPILVSPTTGGVTVSFGILGHYC